jgi:hypothetical protein
MSDYEFMELNMESFKDELPEQWIVYSEYSNGRKPTSFGYEIEDKVFIYMHESTIAETIIKADRTTLKKGKHCILLEMKLNLILGCFRDRRLFDTFDDAKTWALLFMNRYNEFGIFTVLFKLQR